MRDLFASRHMLPVILQSERTECGLACLAMVAAYHGHRLDMNTMRQRYAISARGASLTELQAIAQQLSLQTRALRLELTALGTLKTPVILHWDMSHFVVLKSVTRSGIWIHDPASGLRHYAMAETSRHFTGVALECLPRADFIRHTEVRRSRLLDLFVRAPGFTGAIAQLLVLSLALQVATIGSAFYVQLVMDDGIGKLDREFLAVLALGFGMLVLCSVGLRHVRGMLQIYFANQLGFQMVGNVFHHLMRLPSDYFARRHTGDLVSRFGAIKEIRQVLTEELLTVVLDGLFALATLVAMFYFNAVLTSVVLVFVMVEAAIRLGLTPLIRRLSEQRIVAEARTSSELMESMRAMEIIKFYCCELARIGHWRNHYAEQVNAQVQVSRVLVRVESSYGVLNGIEHVLVIYLAAMAVLDQSISLGFLTAFIALKGHFSTSIRSFIDKLVQMRLLRLQLERVSDITCAEQEFVDFHLPALSAMPQGQLRLQALSYVYPGTHNPVFTDLDLDIQAGEIVAIVGASGSGKSTLIKIMAGLLPPTAGQLMIDGETMHKDNVRRYRNACAGVLQGEQLLSGTLLENITMFADPVDRELLEQSARMARIDDFIATLPMGYNSLIGDMGSIMSAGQGQRVLLARAFYKQARILFLDEATANLDPEVEQEVLVAIKGLGITTIMVTHREAPLRAANRVLRLGNGEIAPLWATTLSL